MKDKLILIGGGGHCASCIDVVESTDRYEIAGILDKDYKPGKDVLGYPVTGTGDDIASYISKGYCFLITVGQISTPKRRMRIFAMLDAENEKLAIVISSRAYVSKHAKIGSGTVIMHDALINVGVEIGVNCIIKSKALIEHGSIIEGHCNVSTSAVINGDCVVGQGSFFGSNAVCKEGTVIESFSFIKAAGFIN